MTAPVELFIALQRELEERLAPVLVERRYMPLVENQDLADMRVSVYIEATEREQVARGISSNRWTFGIAVQKAVMNTGATDCEGDPVKDGIDDLAKGDEVLTQVELIKDFWSEDGDLWDKKLAGFSFLELIHDPVYEPIHLLYNGVFSSIIDVTYQL